MSSIYAVSHSVGQCCVKMNYRGFEISISFDNSCGTSGMTMFRTDMRIYEGDDDVTNTIYPNHKDGIYSVQTDDIKDVFNHIDYYMENK